MASNDAVRKIALSLPGVSEQTGSPSGQRAFSVLIEGKSKGIAWTWLERVHPKKARVPNHDVLAVRVASLEDKEAILSADEEKFFTEPHYNGYPAVMVRIAAVSEAELRKLLTDAWECTAPVELGGRGKTKKRAPKPPPKKPAPRRTASAKKPVAKPAKKPAATAAKKTTQKSSTKRPPAKRPLAKPASSVGQPAAKKPAARKKR